MAWQPWLRGIGIAAILLIYPYVDRAFGLQTLNAVSDAAVYVVLALGLNIVVGYAGLLDLGYAAFFAIGAYTVGIFTWPGHGLEWNFWLVLWISVAVCALFGVIIGSPTLRLRGDYLAIVTLAFGEIVPISIRNLWHVDLRIGDWVLVENFNLTNGPQGLNPVGRPTLFGFEFGFDPLPWYYLILGIAGFTIYVSRQLERSRLGRAWMAIREDETAADCMGINPLRTKLMAFALGAAFSGLGGRFSPPSCRRYFPNCSAFRCRSCCSVWSSLGAWGISVAW